MVDGVVLDASELNSVMGLLGRSVDTAAVGSEQEYRTVGRRPGSQDRDLLVSVVGLARTKLVDSICKP